MTSSRGPTMHSVACACWDVLAVLLVCLALAGAGTLALIVLTMMHP